MPTVLDQAAAATSIGDRPLIVVTAATGAQAGWLAAQDRQVALSTNAVHRIFDSATHESVIAGYDSVASVNAILDVLVERRANESTIGGDSNGCSDGDGNGATFHLAF